MHEFFGHVAEPPKPRWKVAPQLNDDAEYAHPTDASDFHLEMAGVDLLTAEENDVFDTDLPQQAPDSALSQSADGAFGYPQYTPPSYSTDAHRILTETPEQPRRQSQRLPVRLQEVTPSLIVSGRTHSNLTLMASIVISIFHKTSPPPSADSA